MAKEIKGIVRPPMEMPEELRTLRDRGTGKSKRWQMPVVIRIFIGYCFLRAALCLAFGLIVGLLPDSETSAYVIEHFDPFSRELPPEALFYIQAFLYILIGWRWILGDWRARWGVMCISGGTAVRALVWMITDHLVGDPATMSAAHQQALVLGIFVNLLICGFLAFYPGMEQSFRETPWK